jgi:hypothetical protein
LNIFMVMIYIISYFIRINGKTPESISAPKPKEKMTMKQSRFPKGWDENRVKRVLDHYDNQTEDEAVAEDEAAWEDTSHTFIEVPNELVPAVRELLAKKVA